MKSERIREPILVTGATGFIGRRLVFRLREEGYSPRALVLPGDDPPREWGEGVTIVRGDVTHGASVAAAVRDAATVFHLAAMVGDWGAPELHRRVTVHGTENVLTEAAREGARVLLASSVVVYGEAIGREVCDELRPLGKILGPYSASKQEQEKIAHRLEGSHGLAVTIIRPTNVFGPRSVPWVDMVVAELLAGNPALIGDGRLAAGLTYVDNVADVFVRAAERPGAVGRTYNASDDNGVTWLRYFTELAEMCGASPPRSIARPIALVAARALELGFRVARTSRRPPLTREALNLVGSHHRVPISRAMEELGYTPRVSYAEGMRAVAAYLEGEARVITVALDAMGADEGAAPVVHGAAEVSREDRPLRILLVGDCDVIEAALDEVDHDRRKLDIVHAPTFVAPADKPAETLDCKPDCSILRAAQVVAANEADVLVSAGNTGSVILAASRTFERVPGVRRVGLAAVYPTVERHGPREDPFALMLDVGATLSCTAEDLVAFAVMGSCYSRTISEIERPRVGLLSNGTEPQKGTPAIVEAHAILRHHPAVDFAGNVEGLDIPRGSVDVIVCEGFVGNIVLKMLEGVSQVAKDLAREAYGTKLRYKVALAMMNKGIRKIKNLTDWKQYGGAPIVGFDKCVIEAHGRSNARAVRNAIKVAAKTVERQLTQEIRAGMGAENAS